MDHSQPFLIIGIKFHVAALYAVHLSPLALSLDVVTQVNFNRLIRSDNFSLSALTEMALEQPEKASKILDQLLLPWLLDSQHDKHSELAARAITLLKHQPVAQIGHALHCSQRTIERSFLRVTRLTLKQYQSMIRFEELLLYLYDLSGENIQWVEVANKFNFSDQPHLIRYLKSTIGTTPTAYEKRRDLAIDIYGNFE